MTKLLFGYGYLGSRVARLWREQGEEVIVVTRSQAKAQQLAAEGFRPLVLDIVNAAANDFAYLPSIETILFAVGWDRTPGQTIANVYCEGLARVLADVPATDRFIYISSTGVYGACDGDMVDEETPCQPTREGGIACWNAEQLLTQSRWQDRAIILRMAGIYGPGRIPLAQSIRDGVPLAVPADGYLNLIHVNDAARIVLLAEQLAPSPSLFLVSDGHPTIRGEYYHVLARLLHAPPPTFTPPVPDSPAALRSASNKRVSNRRLLDTLHPTLLYPDYRAGLKAIVSSEEKLASS